MRTRSTPTDPLALTASPAGPPLIVGDPEFGLLRDIVHREAGIFLSEAKRALLAGRLAPRLRRLGLNSYLDYWRRVSEDDDERRSLIEAVCTHETQFFRERPQLDLLDSLVFPTWRRAAREGQRAARLRMWCAGCSSGEEPFTLAMMARHHLPIDEGWTIEIHATDLSERVLAKAREALYPIDRIQPIPEELKRRYVLRGVGEREGWARVAEEIRELVQFSRFNLADPTMSLPGSFDLVACRNVLIYFRAVDRTAVIDRLLRSLDPGGLLLVGHSESLREGPPDLRPLGTMVYCRREAPWQRPVRPASRAVAGKR
jgi:chemotaxis protein methyltransferase CheR